VQAAHEAAFALDAFERRLAHARHDAHAGRHVGAVCDFDAAARQRRVDRPHAVGHHVQRAPAHGAGEQGVHLAVRLGRRHPLVVRAGIVALGRAHERQVLGARHVGRVGTVQVAARAGFGVQFQQRAVLQHLADQGVVFGL
jgi:hypothetical protein